MIIGVPRETKTDEARVGLTPGSVSELVASGHEVAVESTAGFGIAATDADYRSAGATVAPDAATIYEMANLIVKVKEPQPDERALLRPDQTLLAYLHLAPDPEQVHDLLSSGATCVAYETITGEHSALPLLAPMSRIAGRLAVQFGARALESVSSGAGVLLGSLPGVPGARVTIIGGGVVGTAAAEVAVGMGATVTVLDRSPVVLERLSTRFGSAIRTIRSTQAGVVDEVLTADLVIGAVLVAGARAPCLIDRETVRAMPAGSALVDVAIDQGGCFATSLPTTHREPTYVVEDVVHCCVPNLPGAVPRTASLALNDVTLPYVEALAAHGTAGALVRDAHLRAGLSIHAGLLTDRTVADALDRPFSDPLVALEAAN